MVNSLPLTLFHVSGSMFFCPTMPEEISSIIKSLRNKKPAKPGNVPISLIKDYKNELPPVLSFLFNKCLNKVSSSTN